VAELRKGTKNAFKRGIGNLKLHLEGRIFRMRQLAALTEKSTRIAEEVRAKVYPEKALSL
jgi:hypothetical protein